MYELKKYYKSRKLHEYKTIYYINYVVKLKRFVSQSTEFYENISVYKTKKSFYNCLTDFTVNIFVTN